MKKLLSVIIVLAMVCSLSAPAFALNATWDGDTSALWATDANWSAAHPVAAETATFNATAGVVNTTVDLGAGAGCGTLLFDTANAAVYTIGSVAGQTLTIANGGGITVNLGVVKTQTIVANVALPGAGAFSNNGANDAFLLNVTGGVTGTGAGTLTLNGTDTGDNTVSGVISDGAGARAVTKAEAGTWVLSGANTYSGATNINGGTLKISAATGLGDHSATNTIGINAGTLRSTAGTYSLDADQDITLNGAGTIQTDADTLTLAAGQTITNGANLLTVTGAGNTTINGVIGAGAGGLTKTGNGTLTLGGANTYTGVTTIGAGTVRIGTGGDFGGGTVLHNATLDIGLNTVHTGIYTQGGASTLMVAIDGTTHGSIVAAGAATVNAGDRLVLAVTNYVPNGATYTIIDSAAASVYATPIITDNSDVVTFTATVVGNDAVLIASRATNGYPERASSSNSIAAGTQLEAAGNAGATGDMATVLNTLDGLSGSEISASLDTVVPEVDAGVINTSTASLNNFVGASLDRIHTVLAPAAGAGSPAKTGVSSGDESKLNGIWAKGYGSYLTQGVRNDIQGYDAWNAGTALGVDRLFSDNITLGISGGYAYGNVDSDVNSANTCINSGQTTIYGGYQDDNYPYFIDVAGTFAWNWYGGSREIRIGNAIVRNANADYDGQQYGVYLGGGYKFNIGKNLELTPLASLQWSHLRTGSYTETDAGALNLSVASQNYDLLQSGLGASIAYPVKVKWGLLTPEAHGKWLYDFIGDDMVVTSTFTGGGGSFNSNGTSPAQHSFNAGGKLSLDMKNDISIIGVCDTEMKDEFFGIYGSVTLRYSF